MAEILPRRRWAGALLLPLLLAACTSTVPGTARPADASGPLPSSTAPAPGPEIVAPPPVGPGTRVEAIRMAAATSLVTTVAPERTESCFPSGPFVDAATLERQAFVAGTAAPALEAHGFVAAWAECGQDAAGLATLAITMEVSDPRTAPDAAVALADAGRAPGDEALVLPASRAIAVVTAGGTTETVQAWAATGRTVAYVFHAGAPGSAREQADALMADQLGLLAAFVPTPQEQVPALPEDPDGLRALAVDVPGEPDPLTGPYSLDSYTRIAIDPVGERALLEANGFAGFYTKQSTDGDLSYAVALYRFPSSAQTNAVYSEFARLETAAYGGVPITTPSIPAAPCFGFDAGSPELPFLLQRCYVGFGSFLASVDVGGVPALDDTSVIDPLLVAQRDLIDG